MNRTVARRLEALAFVLTCVLAILSAHAMLGAPARLVTVVGLAASCFGAGAACTALLVHRRERRP